MYKLFGRGTTADTTKSHQKPKSSVFNYKRTKRLTTASIGNLKIPFPLMLYDVKCVDMTESEILTALTNSMRPTKDITEFATAFTNNPTTQQHSMRLQTAQNSLPSSLTETIGGNKIPINDEKQLVPEQKSKDEFVIEKKTAEGSFEKEENCIKRDTALQQQLTQAARDGVAKVEQQYTISAVPDDKYETPPTISKAQLLPTATEYAILTEIRDALHRLQQQYIEDRREKSTRFLDETIKDLEMMMEIQETQQLLRRLHNSDNG